MKQHRVRFAPEAGQDLIAIYDWIAGQGSPTNAIGYIDRLEAFCNGLAYAAERGSRHDDIRPGLRAIGFERSATIAFTVSDDVVTILGVFRGGRNWQARLRG